MPPPYERHVFVCTNRRPEGHQKGCCASKGSEEVRDLLKAEVGRRGLSGRVRVNAAGCLDACERGVSVVVYPEAVWYGGVTSADVAELVDEHLVKGRPLERLLMKPYQRK
ncbi:MAG: (2Fe-2S) ferredoxin domain-containing protein [Myxococcales bacterium]|nr:(2Fe-2S) ferredoxin domain-containing protein [Myxococcales bacterium]